MSYNVYPGGHMNYKDSDTLMKTIRISKSNYEFLSFIREQIALGKLGGRTTRIVTYNDAIDKLIDAYHLQDKEEEPKE